MSKVCNQCQQAYRGFGATCASCRRGSSEVGAASSPTKVGDATADQCHACGKRVYAMEKKCVEGLLFHKTCFRCAACNCKLECKFGKSELGFFCLTHFHQIAKVTGGYKSGTGPTRNAEAASYVDAIFQRAGTTSTGEVDGAAVLSKSDDVGDKIKPAGEDGEEKASTAMPELAIERAPEQSLVSER